MTLRLATRGSEQARTQSEYVAAAITAATGEPVELVFIETSGDQRRDVPIAEIGGQGVFTKEVQNAVLDGRADLAVHSAKDLPSSWITPGLVLASVPARRDPRDALVGSTLAALRPGAVIATGSVRRQAQLAYLRPDLQFIGLRGNIPTRIAKAADVDAVLVAVAGATWVGLADRLTEILELDTMVPQVGQGAMAIECRTDDASSISACVAIEDAVTRRCVDAERAFLARLGGGCDLPVGAHARVVDGRLDVVGVIAAFDGSELYRSADVGDDPSVGTRLAERLSAQAGHLLSD